MATDLPISAEAAKALIELEDRLVEIERRMSGSPYEVLEVRETDDGQVVLGALAVALGALEVGPEHGDVPPHLRRRLETARQRLEKAAAFLADARARVALDLDIGLTLAVNRGDELRKAMQEELAARRARAPEEEQRAFARARPHVEIGTEKLASGEVKEARSMLRMARLFDPYDLEILELCLAAHDVVASAESMAMLRGTVVSPQRPRPPPVARRTAATRPAATPPAVTRPAATPPAVTRPAATRPAEPRLPPAAAVELSRPPLWPALRLAGLMLLVIVVMASASAAAVLAWPLSGAASSASDGGPDQDAGPAASDGTKAQSGEALPEWVHLLTQARDAAQAGDPARAHALAARSYELQATEQALEVMSLAACEMDDVASARASYVKLVGARARQRVAQLCSRQEIDLRDGVEAATADDLLVRAREASAAGRDDEACDLAGQSQALRHSAEAVQIMVLCACRSGDSERAARLADSLSDAERDPVRSKCSAQGIKLE